MQDYSNLTKLGYINASVSTEYPKQELASFLGIPEPERRQPDIQYFTSIFVSSGFNLNAAYFMPSELIAARDSIVDKPLDIEHEEDKIVGHLFSSAFVYKDGSVFDPVELAQRVGVDVEKIPMDIVTANKVYKTRFIDLAQEIMDGKWSVSMECYYKDYDVIVDGIVIPKLEAESIGLTKSVNNIIPVKEGTIEKGAHRVGRVLRGVLFSGCGLTITPANPRSSILETASHNNDYVLDLTKVDSYMKVKREDETLVLYGFDGLEREQAYISASYGGVHDHVGYANGDELEFDGSHLHVVLPESVPEGYNIYFKDVDGSHSHESGSEKSFSAPEKNHTHTVYVKDKENKIYKIETSIPIEEHNHEVSNTFGGHHCHEIELKDGTKINTVMPKDMLGEESKMSEQDKKEEAGVGGVDGHPLSKPNVCVSFKRYVYEIGGDDPGVPPNSDKTNPPIVPQVESLPLTVQPGGAGDSTPMDKIKHENWCVLFDAACPVPGGQATHPNCLRWVLDRNTKDAITNYYEQIQENRRKAGIKTAVSSLMSTIDRAKSFISGD